MNRTARLLLAVGFLLAVTGCTVAPSSSAARGEVDAAGYLGGKSLPEPYAMPDVALTDATGQSYNLSASPSKPVTLLFFGYTNCREVCVAVLSDIAAALQRMEPDARDQIQVVFVTTDPERDRPTKIRRYLRQFNPDFVGLTGPMADIKRAAGKVGVDIQVMDKRSGRGYEVAHSAHVVGFSRNEGVVIWLEGTPIAALKHDFTLLVDRSR